MKPKASDGRIENQRVTGLLTDLITATGFCEPINSLYFSSQSVEILLAIESFVIVMGNFQECHIQCAGNHLIVPA